MEANELLDLLAQALQSLRSHGLKATYDGDGDSGEVIVEVDGRTFVLKATELFD